MKPAAIGYDPQNSLALLLDVPRRRVFRTLAVDVIVAGAYSALVVYLETNVFGFFMPLGPSFLSILGIILGLLLVCRTNTAYDRWWEGRRLWGQLVKASRITMAPLHQTCDDAMGGGERIRNTPIPAIIVRHVHAILGVASRSVGTTAD